MSILDSLQALDFSDRKTQLVALAGAGIAGYVIFSSRNPASTTDPQSRAADAVRSAQPDVSNVDIPQGNSQNYPGWVGYPELPSTSPTTPTAPTPPAQAAGPCPAGQTAVWRDGSLKCMAQSVNTAQQCPPGYAPVKSSAGTRCVKQNEWGNTPGPTSYIPVDLSGTYQKGYRGMSPAAPAAGGQAFLDSWLGRGGDGPNPYGSVRGFAPNPAPIGIGSVTVRPGDSLSSLARRLYGQSEYWPRLVQRNGVAAASLRAGDRLKG